MKTFFKTISMLLSLIVISAYAVMPAYAADNTVCAPALYYSDFSTAESENAATFGSDWSNRVIARPNSVGGFNTVESGVFGRSQNDKSLKMHTKADVPYTDGDPYQWVGFSGKTVGGAGGYITFSLDVAFDGEMSNKEFDFFFKGEDMTNDGKHAHFMQIIWNGDLRVNGETVKEKAITMKKWYNIRMLMHCGDNTAASADDKIWYSLYLDGEQIVNKKNFTPNCRGAKKNKLYEMSNIWMGQTVFGTKTDDGLYPAREMYFDNILLMSTAKEPSMDNVYYTNSFDYTPETVPADNTPIDTTKWKTFNTVSGTTVKYVPGLGGRPDSDYAIMYSVNGWDGYSSDRNTQLAPNGKTYDSDNVLYNIQYSFLMKNCGFTDNNGLWLQFIGKSAAGEQWSSTPFMRPNGTIGISTDKYFNQNEWNKVRYTVDMINKRIVLYVNDKYVATTKMTEKSTITGISRYKIIMSYPESTKDKPLDIDFDIAFDDFMLYTGMPKSTPGNTVSVDVADEYADSVMISEDKIIVPDGMTAAELKSAIKTNLGKYVYENEDSLAETAKVSDGCVFVVTDGYAYVRYTVSTRNKCGFNLRNFDMTLNGYDVENEFTQGELSLNVSLDGYKTGAELVMALAAYEGSKLSDISVKSVSVTSADYIDGIEINDNVKYTIGDNDTSVKGILLNKSYAMSPVCAPITLAAAPKGEISSLKEVYPSFTNKAVTFSFDDGRVEDKKLIEVFNKYGVAGTFNLVSDQNFAASGTAEELRAAYAGQEIANHVKGHPHMDSTNKVGPAGCYRATADEFINEIESGRTELEAIFGENTVRGYAWPYNDPTIYLTNPGEEAYKVSNYVAKVADLAYARQTQTTNSFDLPENFRAWKFSAHYGSLPSIGERFIADTEEKPRLLALWGHSYEFANAGTPLSLIDDFLKKATENGYWIPTNLELVNYVNAQRAAMKTKNTITNDSDIDLYYVVNYNPVIVKAHSTYTLYDSTTYPTLYLASDSICEDVTDDDVREGWGTHIGDYLDSRIKVSNQAIRSRSTKTFLREGRLDKILETAKPGDYLFVQFGHNDGGNINERGTSATSAAENDTSYRYNLKTYAARAREKGMIPVFLTSVATPYIDNDDYIENWRNAMRETAEEINVPLLDMGNVYGAYLDKIGETAGKELFISDNLHPNVAGAEKIAELVAQEIKKCSALEMLAYYVK